MAQTHIGVIQEAEAALVVEEEGVLSDQMPWVSSKKSGHGGTAAQRSVSVQASKVAQCRSTKGHQQPRGSNFLQSSGLDRQSTDSDVGPGLPNVREPGNRNLPQYPTAYHPGTLQLKLMDSA